MLTKNVLVPIANGIEELEAVSIIDVLRRGGLSLRVSSIEDREITGANGIKIVADSDFIDENIDDYDAIILPGGSEGAKHFFAFSPLTQTLKKWARDGHLIGAICASPAIVLAGLNILDHKKATAYPAYQDLIPNFLHEKVVVDGNIITSQGPGTALIFALTLLEILASKDIAYKVKSDMLV